MFLSHRLWTWPVLAVLTAREEEMAATPVLRQLLSELDRESHAMRLPLGPLSREETVMLTRHLTRAGRPPAVVERLGDRIWEASAGNPFVAVETVRALEEEGAPVADRPLPLPSRVRDTIVARLEGLSDPARELASVAAVIGRQFSFPLAQRTVGLDPAGAAQAVEELVARRVLHVVDEQLEFDDGVAIRRAHRRSARRSALRVALSLAVEQLEVDHAARLPDTPRLDPSRAPPYPRPTSGTPCSVHAARPTIARAAASARSAERRWRAGAPRAGSRARPPRPPC